MTAGETARILHSLAEAVDAGVPVALATVISTRRSVPRHAGTKMLVFGDGRTLGTVGGGEMESRVIDAAVAALDGEGPAVLTFDLLDPQRGDPGVCGGQVEIYVEPIMPPPTLYVFGCGHVGRAVIELAHWLGYRTIAVDDRPDSVSETDVPHADLRLVGGVGEALAAHPIDAHAAVVLVTRSVDSDVRELPHILETDAAYIGVMGSERRWATTRRRIEEAGVAVEELDRVHAPIGVEIGAETVEEIAMSIMAEVVAHRRGAEAG